MAEISRLTCLWVLQGRQPRVQSFWFAGHHGTVAGATAMITTVRDWVSRLRAQVPNDVRFEFGFPGPTVGTWVNTIETYDDVTGALVDFDNFAVGTPLNGIGTGRWIDGMGLRIDLLCDPLPGRVRPLVGYQNLVPWVGLGGSAGQPIESALTAPRNAANAWLTGAHGRGVTPVVWHRPGGIGQGLALPVQSIRIKPQFKQWTRKRRRATA